jgi:hypothetical protein
VGFSTEIIPWYVFPGGRLSNRGTRYNWNFSIPPLVVKNRRRHRVSRPPSTEWLCNACLSFLDRKLWIEHRIEELARIFAVGVGGFAVMDNHLHVLLRLDPDVAHDWSDMIFLVGGLHGAAVSQGQGRNLGGSGRDPRSAE